MGPHEQCIRFTKAQPGTMFCLKPRSGELRGGSLQSCGMIFQPPTSTTRKVRLTFKSTLSDLPRAETEAVKHDKYFQQQSRQMQLYLRQLKERSSLTKKKKKKTPPKKKKKKKKKKK